MDKRKIKMCAGFTEVEKCKKRKTIFLTAWEKAVEQGNIKLLSSSSLHEEQGLFFSVTV